MTCVLRPVATAGLVALTLFLAVACSSRSSELPAGALAVEAKPIEAARLEPAALPESVDPFPGRSEVRVGELFEALAGQVALIASSPEVRRDYERFLAEHKLVDDDELYRDYVRIKLAFEATRAGGLWGLRWRITDQLPQSDRVWAQWQLLRLADEGALPETTAIAECDELSALFAFVARRIGLSRRSEVGLLWPASNHTVAVWTLDRASRAEKRIVVPTSQIFLDGQQSLGTASFDPWRQKNVFDYRRQDVSLELALPAPLARKFVWAIAESGARPQARLQELRNAREGRQ